MSVVVMVQMAACPACRQWVALRGQWADDQPVRCPHCQAEYAAGQARKNAVPELIPLGSAADAPAVAAEPDDPTATSPEIFPTGVETSPAAPAGEGRTAWPRLDSQARPGAPSAKTPAGRPRRKPSSPLVELIKIVGGGAAGLALGYAILLWLGGPRNDFLEILPRLPAWLRPPLARSAPEGDAADEAGFPRNTAAPNALDASPALDLRTSSEPETAARLAPPNPATWPLGIAPSTAAEVRQAVAAVEATLVPGPVEQGTPPPAPERRAALAATAWERLIELSTRLAPSDPEGGGALAAVEKLAYRRLAAADTADTWNRRAVAQLADRADRDQGIALVGRLQQVERRGSWFLSQFVLVGQPKLATLVSAEPLEFKPGDDLAVLGLLLDAPRQRFAGYEGPAQGPVVWPGVVVKIAAPAAKYP
jgi:hypothetical protein